MAEFAIVTLLAFAALILHTELMFLALNDGLCHPSWARRPITFLGFTALLGFGLCFALSLHCSSPRW